MDLPLDDPALLARVDTLLGRPGRTALGIAGAPGAGKSTLVEQLLLARAGAPIAHLPMDGFHLADVQLDRLGARDRKGAPDTFDVHGFVATLRRLRAEADVPLYAPGFERELEQPLAAAVLIPPSARLVITEGNYLLHDVDGWERVRPLLDDVWFLDLDDDVRRDRLVQRHERYGKSPEQARAWVAGSDEPNAALVARHRERADVVVRAGVNRRGR